MLDVKKMDILDITPKIAKMNYSLNRKSSMIYNNDGVSTNNQNNSTVKVGSSGDNLKSTGSLVYTRSVVETDERKDSVN